MNTKTLTLTALALVAASATAQPVEIRVDIENLAPQNSVAFAPLRVGFHNGTYDSFNNGQAASDAIISIAEGGSGDAWFPAFGAADPTATLGSVLTDGGGPLTPGATGSASFTIDPAINRYFTFASMVVPSNDSFIGNDSPTQYQLLDEKGNLLISEIVQTGNDIWDAGSEVNGIFGSAFLEGAMNSDRIAENGVVGFDFTQFDIYNGETTGAGYTFDRQFSGDDALYRISFSVVPAPAGTALLGLGGLVAVRRRR
ncbi:MAG: spondin domain-containing protein [bacterium]|nr:spondin domain-containing protein [bacterium]